MNMTPNFLSRAFRSLALPALACGLICAAAATAFGQAKETPRVDHWVFDEASLKNGVLTPAQGGQTAAILGQIRFSDDMGGAMMFDGVETTAQVGADITKVKLPESALTIEAWVRIDRAGKWGGIFSALQDNGDYEKGLLLGLHDSHFCFGLAAQSSTQITYLQSKSSYEPGSWHHVAGVYDGTEMRIYVDGVLNGSSDAQKGKIVYPPDGWVMLGAYRDKDEYYKLHGELREVKLTHRALSQQEITEAFKLRANMIPEGLILDAGPFIQLSKPSNATVTWRTQVPAARADLLLRPSRPKNLVQFGKHEDRMTYLYGHPPKSHTVELDSLDPNQIYTMTLYGPLQPDGPRSKARYEFDSSLNYAQEPGPAVAQPFGKQAVPDLFRHAEFPKQLRTDAGYALLLGAGDGRGAFAMARVSKLRVIAVEPDAAIADNARQLLDSVGYHGMRVSVWDKPLTGLPLGPYAMNLIVCESAIRDGKPVLKLEEIAKALRPEGGIALLSGAADDAGAMAKLKEWAAPLAAGQTGYSLQSIEIAGRSYLKITRGRMPGAGWWTHQYGQADNASTSGDKLITGSELDLLWWGRPGARPMPDRGARNPAPLAAGGRLYIQGDRILFGQDAYNGTILWSMIVPELRRTNLPRCSANMAADDDSLFIAARHWAARIDGDTGKIDPDKDIFLVPTPAEGNRKYEWGYLAREGKLLIGSSVRAGSFYMGDDGEWYDTPGAEDVGRITSDELFAYHKDAPRLAWRHRKGVILNSTITIADGVIYFIESRSELAAKATSGRLLKEVSDKQFMVALDAATGAPKWEKPVNLPGFDRMTYLSFTNMTLTVVGSSAKEYSIKAYDAGAGSDLWNTKFPISKDHHGGAIQHPVLLGDAIYCEQRAYDLRTGKLLRTDLPERRGCGTMSASASTFFYRHHHHGLWDLNTNKRLEFQGIRSGCWLGILPAGGVVLAPETSSGCSCTHSIQTSAAFVPRKAK